MSRPKIPWRHSFRAKYELTPIEREVMLCVLEAQGKPLNQKEQSARIDMLPEDFCRTLAALEARGFIKKGSPQGKSKPFFLDPRFDWLLRAKDGKLAVIGPMERP